MPNLLILPVYTERSYHLPENPCQQGRVSFLGGEGGGEGGQGGGGEESGQAGTHPSWHRALCQ